MPNLRCVYDDEDEHCRSDDGCWTDYDCGYGYDCYFWVCEKENAIFCVFYPTGVYCHYCCSLIDYSPFQPTYFCKINNKIDFQINSLLLIRLSELRVKVYNIFKMSASDAANCCHRNFHRLPLFFT